MKAQRSFGVVAAVDSIKNHHVKMHVQIQRATESVDERHRPALWNTQARGFRLFWPKGHAILQWRSLRHPAILTRRIHCKDGGLLRWEFNSEHGQVIGERATSPRCIHEF